jgi:GntR family transcriptional regulator
MAPHLHIDASDATPIWKQIQDGVRRLVASGGLARGAPVPSVRELSRELRINPATVAKAYQRLTDEGVLAVRRGEGTFVAEDPPAMTRGERQRILRDAATRYATTAVTIGAEAPEAVQEVRQAWERLERGGQRRNA